MTRGEKGKLLIFFVPLLTLSVLSKIVCSLWYGLNTASGLPYISLLILAFLNRCISVKTSLINSTLKDFVNLGVLFLAM